MSKGVNWKTIAIIAIVIAVLEFLILVWAMSAGTQMIEDENECAINVCNAYDTYYFDEITNVCYCYLDGDDGYAYQEFIK